MSSIRNGTVDFDLTGVAPRVGNVQVGAFGFGIDHVTIGIDAGIQGAPDAPPAGTPLTIKAQARHLRALAEGILAALEEAQPELDRVHELVPAGMHGGRR